MAKFRGTIEDKKYKLHPFEVEAETREGAEYAALIDISNNTGFSIDDLDIIVCSEVLTQAQADQYEKDHPEQPTADNDGV